MISLGHERGGEGVRKGRQQRIKREKSEKNEGRIRISVALPVTIRVQLGARLSAAALQRSHLISHGGEKVCLPNITLYF